MLSLIALSSSCKPSAPTLDVKGASLAEADLDGVVVNVNVVVGNQNSFPIFADVVDFTATLEKKVLARGRFKQRVTVDAKGSTPVTVPVRLRYAEVGLVAGAAAKRVDWRYGVTGEVALAPIDALVVKLPFATDGVIEAPRLPTVSLGRAALTDVSARSVTVAVTVSVANPNAFALPVGRARSTVLLGGEPVRLTAAIPSVPPKGSVTVVLRQPVPIAALGKAAVDVAAGKGVEAVVDGSLAFGSNEVSLAKTTVTLAR